MPTALLVWYFILRQCRTVLPSVTECQQHSLFDIKAVHVSRCPVTAASVVALYSSRQCMSVITVLTVSVFSTTWKWCMSVVCRHVQLVAILYWVVWFGLASLVFVSAWDCCCSGHGDYLMHHLFICCVLALTFFFFLLLLLCLVC